MNLKNRYFVLRHGHSIANETGIILSHLEHGKSEEFSLTQKGEGQVINSVTKAKEAGELGDDTVIISSPFSRCRRTAEIAKEILGVSEKIFFDDRLRERWFGNFERQTNDNYGKVWEIDKIDSAHKSEGVESADEVRERMVDLINDCEKNHFGKKILLVSHGDALQILLTWFCGKQASVHRELQHLETSEIRRLN